MAALAEGALFAGYLAATGAGFAALAATAPEDRATAPSFPDARSVYCAGLSTAIGSSMLNLTDVCKVRIQAESLMGKAAEQRLYLTFGSTIRQIVKDEGVFALWRPGLTSTAMRDLSYSGIRVGLYPLMKTLIAGADGENDIGVAKKLMVGMVTGALGSAIANPTDLVKIRMQAEAGALDGATGRLTSGLSVGEAPRYNNSWDCAVKISSADGFAALYAGTSATIVRAAMGTGAQMACYDHAKHLAKERGMVEGPLLHSVAGFLSGLAFATGAAPADIVKSRYMSGVGKFSGVGDCAWQLLSKEGPLVLFKGWFPSACRVGPLFIFVSPVMEQMRILVGLEYF